MSGSSLPAPHKRKRQFKNKTGFTGVNKSGKKYRATITINCVPKYLGSFDTKAEAGIAYDRAAVETGDSSGYTLNFPNMTDEERVQKKKKRGAPNLKTGFIGVCKRGNRYRAQIRVDNASKHLGRFVTRKEAGKAYDAYVLEHNMTDRYNLNADLAFPSGVGTVGEDEEEDDEEEEDEEEEQQVGADDEDKTANLLLMLAST
jgi:transcription elongation factor Elf1